MSTYNVLEAKTNFSRLIDAIESGREKEIVIARNGRPAARLVPLETRQMGQRIGVGEGLFKSPDDIDGANEYIARLFNGEAE